jgi:hypothetical protein
MAIKKTPSGQVQIDASLTKGVTFQSKGGGFNFTLQTSDEHAIDLFKRIDQGCMVTLDFYSVEQTIDDSEGPGQQTFNLDKDA